jgi:hypothetical protein
VSLFNISRFFGKRIRSFIGFFYPFIWFEKRLINSLDNNSYITPIFIIGAPRSGSTLLYQLLAYYYEFSYINNLSSIFYKSPALITYLTKYIFKPYSDKSLSSAYGLIKGIWSPSEAGAVFNHWFDNDKINNEYIRKSIIRIGHIYKRPFLCKNLKNYLRLERIYEIFPDAFFVYIKRNLIYNAQSIIIGLYKDKQEMKAVPSVDKSSGDIYKQAIDDILLIQDSIESFLTKNNCKYIQIDYDKLCDNNEKELKRFEELCQKYDLKLNKKCYDKLNLDKSNKIKLSKSDWKKLFQIIIESDMDIPHENKC